jgi:hypothetical protein
LLLNKYITFPEYKNDWHCIGITSNVTEYLSFKTVAMLYVIAVILIIGWLLGFFVFSAGNLIHILLVVAIIAILLRVIQGRNPV